MGRLSSLFSAACIALRRVQPLASASASVAVTLWIAYEVNPHIHDIAYHKLRMLMLQLESAELRKETTTREKDIEIKGTEAAKHARLVSSHIASYAKSSPEQYRILAYALDSKLSPEEVLYEDATKRILWTRKNFINLVGRSMVPHIMSDLCLDHINKSSLRVHEGYFKRFIFRITFAHTEIQDDDSSKKDDNAHLTRVRKHLSNMSYLSEGKINDANKCEFWCIPISYQGHARSIVINIKDACYEYLDSGDVDSKALCSKMGDLPERIVKPVTIFINSMRQQDNDDHDNNLIDFSKFTWTFPALPRQPVGSKACAIYRMRFLEEWNGASDLGKFEGWDEESWHVKERVKMCATVLTDDSNVILDEVKGKAQKRHGTEN